MPSSISINKGLMTVDLDNSEYMTKQCKPQAAKGAWVLPQNFCFFSDLFSLSRPCRIFWQIRPLQIFPLQQFWLTFIHTQIRHASFAMSGSADFTEMTGKVIKDAARLAKERYKWDCSLRG